MLLATTACTTEPLPNEDPTPTREIGTPDPVEYMEVVNENPDLNGCRPARFPNQAIYGIPHGMDWLVDFPSLTSQEAYPWIHCAEDDLYKMEPFGVDGLFMLHDEVRTEPGECYGIKITGTSVLEVVGNGNWQNIALIARYDNTMLSRQDMTRVGQVEPFWVFQADHQLTDVYMGLVIDYATFAGEIYVDTFEVLHAPPEWCE